MDKHSKAFKTETNTLKAMISIYCRGRHKTAEGLCSECTDLANYALGKLQSCTFGEDKPKCSQCHIHCYKPEMRDMIRSVMRYAGPRMIHRHPVLAAQHILRGVRHKPGRKNR